MTRTRRGQLRRGQLPNLPSCAWSITTAAAPSSSCWVELLADLETEPQGATIQFAGCDQLGAANLRGTGYAAKDTTIHQLRAKDHETWRLAEINVTGLAGFLLAKTAAAHSRRKPKDWYDIAFVLLNNERGDTLTAAERVRDVFGEPTGAVRTQLQDLQANFADRSTQGTSASSTRSPWTIPRSTRTPQPRMPSWRWGCSPTGCSAVDAAAGDWP